MTLGVNECCCGVSLAVSVHVLTIDCWAGCWWWWTSQVIPNRWSLLLPVTTGDFPACSGGSDTRSSLHHIYAGLLCIFLQDLDWCLRIQCQGRMYSYVRYINMLSHIEAELSSSCLVVWFKELSALTLHHAHTHAIACCSKGQVPAKPEFACLLLGLLSHSLVSVHQHFIQDNTLHILLAPSQHILSDFICLYLCKMSDTVGIIFDFPKCLHSLNVTLLKLFIKLTSSTANCSSKLLLPADCDGMNVVVHILILVTSECLQDLLPLVDIFGQWQTRCTLTWQRKLWIVGG